MKNLSTIMNSGILGFELFTEEYGNNLFEVFEKMLNLSVEESTFLRDMVIRVYLQEIGMTICKKHAIREDIAKKIAYSVGDYLIEDALTEEDEIVAIKQQASELPPITDEFAGGNTDLYQEYSQTVNKAEPQYFAINNSEKFWGFLKKPKEQTQIVYKGQLLDESCESRDKKCFTTGYSRHLLGKISDVVDLIAEELIGNSDYLSDFVDFDFNLAVYIEQYETLAELRYVQENFFGAKKIPDLFGHEEQQTIACSYYGNGEVYFGSYYDGMTPDDFGWKLQGQMIQAMAAEGIVADSNSDIFVSFIAEK